MIIISCSSAVVKTADEIVCVCFYILQTCRGQIANLCFPNMSDHIRTCRVGHATTQRVNANSYILYCLEIIAHFMLY